MRAFLVVASLVAADQATKLFLHTPDWGWDDKALPVQAWAVGFAACAVLCSYRPVRVPAVLMLAGLVGNFVSAVNGDVANPFVWHGTAYNLADFLIISGYALLPLMIPLIYLDIRSRLENRLIGS